MESNQNLCESWNSMQRHGIACSNRRNSNRIWHHHPLTLHFLLVVCVWVSASPSTAQPPTIYISRRCIQTNVQHRNHWFHLIPRQSFRTSKTDARRIVASQPFLVQTVAPIEFTRWIVWTVRIFRNLLRMEAKTMAQARYMARCRDFDILNSVVIAHSEVFPWACVYSFFAP